MRIDGTTVLLAIAAASGCFGGSFLRGTACETDADCGPSLSCADGVCGGRPDAGDGGTTSGADGSETTSEDGNETTAGAEDTGTTTSAGGESSTGTTTSTASSDDGMGSSTSSGGACDTIELGSTLPVKSERISTLGAANSLSSGDCGGDLGSEIVFTWSAPTNGNFAVDAIVPDASFSPILYLLEGEGCGGVHLSCDRPAYGGARAATTVGLLAGETIAVVVDSDSASAGGEVEVEIRDATLCVDEVVTGDVPVEVTRSTTGRNDDSQPGGAGDGSPDFAFSWVAPRTGRYMIDTAGTEFDSILSVQKGGCFGKELAFADAAEFAHGGEFVAVDLGQGDEIVVLVDGYTEAAQTPFGNQGQFTVHINDSLSCAESTITTSPDTRAGDTTLLGNDFGGWLVKMAGQIACPYGTQAPDVAYSFEASQAGVYEFDVSQSSFPAVVSTFRSGCILPDSALVFCAQPEFQGQPENQIASTLLEQGGQVLIVLDGEDLGDEGLYQLDVRRVGGCFDEDLQNDEFVARAASTVGRKNRVAPLCNVPNESADYIARWRANHAGRWRFYTSQADFGTAIAVFRGQCSIDQIACDRGSGGGGNSEVVVDLEEDEEVTVSVDAVQLGGVGTFTLNISPAP